MPEKKITSREASFIACQRGGRAHGQKGIANAKTLIISTFPILFLSSILSNMLQSKELEKQITEQIQMKTKAEKKLQLLKKKLESLNLPSTMVNSEPSISSEICDEDKPKTLMAASSLPSNSQAISESSHSEEENQDARGSTRLSSSDSEICSDKPSKGKIENGGEEFDSMDDSLAIVAVKLPEKSETGELKAVISERIIEVLNDLKQARKRIQSSMEIRELNKIQVSPV